jgi:glyoxylase I family protein
MAAIDHISLTVSDLQRALPFYTRVLGFLSYRLAHAGERAAIWRSGNGGPGFNLWQARPELADYAHRLYAPGYHHLAFAADSREQVDALHALLQEGGHTVLDPPLPYEHYAPGYYALYFADPDGLKYELAYVPRG